MKVKLKVDISGSRDGLAWPRRGEAVELPDEEAAALCAAGMAEPVAVKQAEQAETAVPPAPELRAAAAPATEALATEAPATETRPLTTKRGPGRPRKADADATAEG